MPFDDSNTNILDHDIIQKITSDLIYKAPHAFKAKPNTNSPSTALVDGMLVTFMHTASFTTATLRLAVVSGRVSDTVVGAAPDPSAKASADATITPNVYTTQIHINGYII